MEKEKTPEGWGPGRVEGPKFRAFLFSLPPEISFFLLSLCEAPASPKPRGFHTTTRESKRAHLRVRLSRERRKVEMSDGREKRKSEILGGPAEGALQSGLGERPKNLEDTHQKILNTHNTRAQLDWCLSWPGLTRLVPK